MTSLRTKLTLPVLLVVVVAFTVYSGVVYDMVRQELRDQYLHRGRLLINSLGFSLEKVNHASDMLRVVQAFAAESGVLLVVLALDSPARVVAASRMQWLGREVDELPEVVRHDLTHMIHAKGGLAHFDIDSMDRLHLGRSMLLMFQNQGGEVQSGVLLVHIDASEMNRRLRDIEFTMLGTLVLLVVVLMVTIWYMLQRSVFRPMRHLTEAMARRAAGDNQAQALISSRDEIGQVALAFNHLVHALASHEAAIVAERDRAELFLEASEAVVVGLNARDQITLINSWGKRLLRRRDEEIMGRNWFEVAMPGSQQGRARQVFHAGMAGDLTVNGVALELHPKAAAPHILAWNFRPLRDSRGEVFGVLASGLDITRRIQAEQALRDSEEQFRSTFENAPIGMCLISQEHQFKRVNTAFTHLLGLDESELLGRQFCEVLAHSEVELASLVSDLSGNLLPVIREMQFLHASGRVVWTAVGVSQVRDGRGHLRFYVVQVQDITARKQAETEIFHRMEVEKAISMASQDLITHQDPYYSLSLAWMARAIGADRASLAVLTGAERQLRVLGTWVRSDLPHHPSQGQEEDGQYVWLLNRFEIPGFHGWFMVNDVHALPDHLEERRFLQQRGVAAWICLPIRYAKGEVRGFLSFDRLQTAHAWRAEDISALQVVTDMLGSHWQRLEFEEEKLVIQERAMRTAHLASLGMLSAGVAHEINNPNNLIMFNAPMIGKIWESAAFILKDQQAREGAYTLARLPVEQVLVNMPRLITGIQESAQRIQRIVAQLKRLVRSGQAGHAESVDLVKLIHDALSIIAVQMQKRACILHLDLEEGMPPVLGSVQELEQVFLNVMVNALESLPAPNRAIWIQTMLAPDGQTVSLAVRDEGAGIPAEVLNRVTEPLFTTKGETGGTGLGLAICKGILEKYGGSLELASMLGEGTTVTVRLAVFRLQGKVE